MTGQKKPTRELPASEITFEAPANVGGAGSGTDEQRQFEGTAYSGAPVEGLFDRIIVDLESTTNPGELPVLMGHDRDKIAGVADQVSIGDSIEVNGKLTQATEYGQQVAQLSDEGFPWQLSIHVQPGSLEEVQAGQSATVNGQDFAGPGLIYRNNQIREVSFTPTGKDANTTARALSDQGDRVQIPVRNQEDNAMTTPRNDRTEPNGNGQEGKTLEQMLAEERAARQEAEGKLQAAEDRAQAAEGKLHERLQAERKERVKALFSQLGREYSDEAAKPYLEMSDEVFQVYEKDLKAAAGSTGAPEGGNPPEGLFSEQAQAGESEGEEAAPDAPRQGVQDKLAQV